MIVVVILRSADPVVQQAPALNEAEQVVAIHDRDLVDVAVGHQVQGFDGPSLRPQRQDALPWCHHVCYRLVRPVIRVGVPQVRKTDHADQRPIALADRQAARVEAAEVVVGGLLQSGARRHECPRRSDQLSDSHAGQPCLRAGLRVGGLRGLGQYPAHEGQPDAAQH